jgi:hypothetical protein
MGAAETIRKFEHIDDSYVRMIDTLNASIAAKMSSIHSPLTGWQALRP